MKVSLTLSYLLVCTTHIEAGVILLPALAGWMVVSEETSIRHYKENVSHNLTFFFLMNIFLQPSPAYNDQTECELAI